MKHALGVEIYLQVRGLVHELQVGAAPYDIVIDCWCIESHDEVVCVNRAPPLMAHRAIPDDCDRGRSVLGYQGTEPSCAVLRQHNQQFSGTVAPPCIQ